MEVLVTVPPRSDWDQIVRRVRSWEELGVSGVMTGDHLFVASQASSSRSAARTGYDPYVLLSAIGGLSHTLKLGTLVANTGFAHPALILRHFFQLAAIYGPNRVIAGLGGGWNSEEFDALGLEMPSHARRIQRLEEALALAYRLIHEGVATVDGSEVATRALPMAPRVSGGGPDLLVGGGSDRLLRAAGRWANRVDLNGSPGSPALRRTDPWRGDAVRRLSTRLEDLIQSVAIVRDSEREAGREPGSVRFSLLLDPVRLCRANEVDDVANEIADLHGVEKNNVLECPYALIGGVPKMLQHIREVTNALPVETLIFRDGAHIETICRELLGGAG